MISEQKNIVQKKKVVYVRVCVSPKSCGKKGAKYIWERICNENGVTDYTLESFEKGGVCYEKTACQGFCEKGPNVKIEEDSSPKTLPFPYVNPLKAGKLVKKIQSGTSIKDIKRL